MPRRPEPSRSAAIFDLDRTLLRGSSASILQPHLRAEVSAGGSRSELLAPLVDAWDRLYRQWGESVLTVAAARAAVGSMAGWDVAQVARAAEAGAADLVEAVLPYARAEIEAQRRAGRQLVLATSTPAPLITPFAERLGFDAVVATELSVREGRFTGIDGAFRTGPAKLAAVEQWAAAAGVDLASSVAFSDSVLDAPLLGAVGTAVAVNPDAQLEALARLRRWEVRHFDVAPGVVKIGGRELQEWFRPYNDPALIPGARFEITGDENVPRQGPAIVVFNHRSYFDPTAINVLLARVGRTARFLSKREITDAPIIGRLARAVGAIRVDRASGSDEPLEAAAAALRAGELVCVAPQGTIPRGPAFFDPELQGRWGAARLASLSGAPVVPVGLWGTEVIWPRSARLPRLNLSRPLVSIRVGAALTLEGDDHDANTRRLMSAIVEQLPEAARVARTPTAVELARTYPPGYRGDPDAERARRPGRDTGGGTSR